MKVMNVVRVCVCIFVSVSAQSVMARDVFLACAAVTMVTDLLMPAGISK